MECIFVGYSAIHKAYKVYHPSTHQIYISNQCKFDEAIFPATVSSVASGISAASGSGISGASGSGIFFSGSGISEESSVPAGSSYFGPTTAAVPGPASPANDSPMLDPVADPSYAPSPLASPADEPAELSSDMVTDSVSASSSPIVTFPDESDDELESESVPLLTITNDAGTVLDRSLIPVEHAQNFT
ncbi:unnamed protein product [[Candida] boidinii]|nr:unnamed protein product [[Candida] boidinii]